MFLSLWANATGKDSLLVEFAEAMDGILNPLESIVDVITDVNQMLDQLDPLGAIGDWFASVMDDIGSWFDFSVTQSLGGNGDDVLASGSGGGDMVGGLGHDTYLFTFGFGGEHIVDEAGFNAARDWASLLQVGDGLFDSISGGGGGTDVVEIRGPYGFFDIDIENLAFLLSHSGDLTIGLQTEGGYQLDMGTVVIKDMDDMANRIETLRIVNQDEIVDIDLGAAFDAGLFTAEGGLSQWWDETVDGVGEILDGEIPFSWTDNANAPLDAFVFVADPELATTQEKFGDKLDGWVTDIKTAAGTAGVVGDQVARLADGVGTWASSTIPELPEVFDFA
jgi:hypothetical protein